jgi:hypothetical protein
METPTNFSHVSLVALIMSRANHESSMLLGILLLIRRLNKTAPASGTVHDHKDLGRGLSAGISMQR